MRGSRLVRGLVATLAALGLGLAMFSVSGLWARPQGKVAPEPVVSAAPPSSVEVLQERLRRLPNDWTAWSALGAAYLDEAVATGDPAYYDKAEGALQKSLALHPQENAAALSGQAALAASRHDFSTALELARTSQRLNPYSPTNQGVLVDALMELGRYRQAEVELQQMVDLKPSVPAYTRVSYYRELRGDIPGARQALEQADALAFRPADKAFIARYLAELSFSTGDLSSAREHVDRGLRAAPREASLLATRAKTRVAAGDLDGGLQDYTASTALLPLSTTIADHAVALRAAGRVEDARRQDALAGTTYQLLRDNGSNVDLELALYEADRGNSTVALAAARREYERRVSVHTEDALAWALHAAGQDKAALKHARAAERLSTTNATFAYHRGIIEHSLGMKSAARASLRRALRTNPYFSPAGSVQARRTLQGLTR